MKWRWDELNDKEKLVRSICFLPISMITIYLFTLYVESIALRDVISPTMVMVAVLGVNVVQIGYYAVKVFLNRG